MQTSLPNKNITHDDDLNLDHTSPHIISEVPKKKLLTNKTIISVVSTFLLLFFFFWLTTTIFPIVIVEAKYQYKKAIQDTFKTDSLLGALIPNFKTLNFNEKSKHQEYGIRIPSIFIDEPVVFNVDPNDEKAYTQALKTGIAHASSTSFPDTGGVGYYFAHSSSRDARIQMNAVFYLLGKMEIGDDIFIWHEGKKNAYRVFETRTTSPDDVSFLNEQFGDETIVLQTCWPPGTTEKRLLVFGERVEE